MLSEVFLWYFVDVPGMVLCLCRSQHSLEIPMLNLTKNNYYNYIQLWVYTKKHEDLKNGRYTKREREIPRAWHLY